MHKNKYKKTLIACYLGFVTQAISANFTPLLFLTFHRTFGISLGKIAILSTAFFLTQLVVDFFCAKFVDKIGYRKCIVASEVLSALGLTGLAFLPNILPDAYMGIILSVVIYAIGSGLIEVLVSPIVEACPFEKKEMVMSTLHSFYCWGSVAVVLLSTLIFNVFGIDNWQIVACLWAIIPLYNVYNFLTCPIERLTEEGQGMGLRALGKVSTFRVAIVLMICAGASEISMSQWASAYVEAALGLPKSVGDLMGPCFFAVAMGISRSFYGKFGEKIDLLKFMVGSGALCLCCYLLAALSVHPAFGLIGCIVCGFSVGIMWPGTISITSKKMPLGGTALFAMLAMAGDLGGSVGPALVGFVAQGAGNDMKAGMLAGAVFPAVLIIAALLMRGKGKSEADIEAK